ncbi:MAG: ankyrin repeat domain-containing protein [Rickettsiales bacterium]|jgi:hypothetical protein|nr:ankyrin repeat domain-containing protein [Rickettsiales bacterium]
MKRIKILLFALFFAPVASFAASDFEIAAQLLSAAKNADIQQVQALVNNGANINFTDNTGMSVVCTALMNKDTRAAQILQMYGADASKCDQQIKRYNKKLPKEESGGLFSGLSTTKSIALAAAGAAVVVGGLLLLTDVLDPGNNNNSDGTSSGNRPGGGGTGGGGTATEAFALPFGPAMPNTASENASYTSNLNYYSPSTDGILKDNFALMTNSYAQNYLLMMRGYSPLARGYMGMRTLRNTISRAPIPLDGNNLGTDLVLGSRPVNVALITANGINAAPKPANDYSETNSSLDDALLPWTTTNSNGTIANPANNDMISSKYYNNKIFRGSDNGSLTDDSTIEDADRLDVFDLSGSGTAVNNAFASDMDNLLAKVVGGKSAGYAAADFMGFMPNGQMTIFRTGGGKGMKTVSGGTVVGSLNDTDTDLEWDTGETIRVGGIDFTITMNGNSFVATNASVPYSISGYIGADGLYYVDSDSDGYIDSAYSMSVTDLVLAKQLADIDYYNYKALLSAGALWVGGDSADNSGRSRPDIIANVSVISPLRGRDVETVSDVLSFSSASRQSGFLNLVNKYYNRDESDGLAGADDAPSTSAASFFLGLGSLYSPLVIFSTGAFETDNVYSGRTLEAGFENSAPLVFDNLEHLFMSVVAVGLTGSGTNGASSVSGYSPSGQIALSQWHDNAEDKYYKSRVCGLAGSGAAGIDPWCFAAAGITDELAVASLAGAAGALKSAFDYMNNKELFVLMALTADGPYLGSNDSGGKITADELKSYLQSMYKMPEEYQYKWEQGGEDYLAVFKEVFGYGLVNLERATKPTSKVYYYDGSKIVSGNGNAYWRAATNTIFRTSSIFNPRAASISAPFYDILESSDGSLSLPRVWENEFALGASDVRGLYMGDVLGEFQVRKKEQRKKTKEGFDFDMSFSEKQYVDNLSGLDDLRFYYNSGSWNFAAGYQRHFTDGASRFNGMAHPILSMAANSVATDAEYVFGNWKMGARAFSGSITDESLLENDPTLASQYQPAILGRIDGAMADVSWGNEKFSISAGFGTARETDTILGAYTGGLLALGGAETTYIDAIAAYNLSESINLSLRSTFARTDANSDGEYILGISQVESNSFALGADIGNFSFAVARPLAVVKGGMKYAHAEYEVFENDDGNFELAIKDMNVAKLDLRPESRELRFSGEYRVNLGAHTDGAFGFIYRVNPNHTKEFGNESILMMKFSHKVGI